MMAGYGRLQFPKKKKNFTFSNIKDIIENPTIRIKVLFFSYHRVKSLAKLAVQSLPENLSGKIIETTNNSET